MDEMERARLEIDEADREMAALFEKRMEAAKTIAFYKKERGLPIYVPERERAVISKNAALIQDPGIRAHYIQFLQHTMNASKRYQRELISGARIAYSGIVGAFANIAAERIFPEGHDQALTGHFNTVMTKLYPLRPIGGIPVYHMALDGMKIYDDIADEAGKMRIVENVGRLIHILPELLDLLNDAADRAMLG